MEIKRTKLLEVLGMVKPALAKLDLVPMLRHVCLSDKTVRATNGTVALKIKLDHDLNCLVLGDTLSSFLSNCADEKAVLIPEEGLLEVSVGRSRARLPVGDLELFPKTEFPEDGIEHRFELGEGLLEALAFCRPAVLSDQVVTAMSHLRVSGLDVFAATHVQVSWARVEMEYPEMLLSPEVADLLAVFPPGDTEVELARGLLRARTEGMELVAALPTELSFPKCTDIFVSNAPSVYLTVPPELNGAIERAALFSEKGDNAKVTLTFSGGLVQTLTVFAKAEALGDFQEEMPISIRGGAEGQPVPTPEVLEGQSWDFHPGYLAEVAAGATLFGLTPGKPHVVFQNEENTRYRLLAGNR